MRQSAEEGEVELAEFAVLRSQHHMHRPVEWMDMSNLAQRSSRYIVLGDVALEENAVDPRFMRRVLELKQRGVELNEPGEGLVQWLRT